jgi:hypothetical protein
MTGYTRPQVAALSDLVDGELVRTRAGWHPPQRPAADVRETTMAALVRRGDVALRGAAELAIGQFASAGLTPRGRRTVARIFSLEASESPAPSRTALP